MRGWTKRLLTVELLVCFLPSALLLLVGATMLPMQIVWLFQEPLHWQGGAWVASSVVCGTVGVCTLSFVVSRLFAARERIERPAPVLAGVLLGTAPLLFQVIFAVYAEGDPDLGVLTFLVLLPLLATAHILYLSRNMFITGFRDGERTLPSPNG